MTPTSKFASHLATLSQKFAATWTDAERDRLTTQIQWCERSKFIELNGITHHYIEMGPENGHPVLLIHGWDCSSHWFYRLMPVLAARGFRAIAFDLRGHGFSDSDPDGRYAIPVLANDVLALADRLGLASFHLVSFSLGSAVALLVNERAPQRVRSQVVMNFGLFDHNSSKERIIPGLLDTVFRGLRMVKWWMPVYGYIRLTLCKRSVDILDIEMGMSSLTLCDPVAARGAVTDLSTLERTAQIQNIARDLKTPLLAIAGDGDPVVPAHEVFRLAETAPTGELHILERTGHLVLFERVDAINDLIASRLQKVEGSPRSVSVGVT